MKEEAVVIPSGPLKLEGLIAKPAGSSPAPGAVVCHPHPLYGGSMQNNVVEAILKALWRLGYATIRFNFRSVGASEGQHTGGVGEGDDAKAVMRFLLEQQGIAKDHALMAGYSFGAAVAMRAGAEMDQVETIAGVALPVGMGDFAHPTANKKIVLIAGDRDGYCPKPRITELAQNCGGRLRMIDGADHFFGGYEDSLTDALVELLSA